MVRDDEKPPASAEHRVTDNAARWIADLTGVVVRRPVAAPPIYSNSWGQNGGRPLDRLIIPVRGTIHARSRESPQSCMPGATPWQTLVAATRHGAEVCGVGAELGTVEVGKLADLIVVGANPLEDITNVRRLQMVLKQGRVVSDKRHPSGAET